MGALFYGGAGGAIDIDDRTLAHLKIVIAMKLRRAESFTISWLHPSDQPGARSTIWLHPSIPLRFIFDEEEPPEISTQWLEQLTAEANSAAGIRVAPEHFARYGDGDGDGDGDGEVWGRHTANDVE